MSAIPFGLIGAFWGHILPVGGSVPSGETHGAPKMLEAKSQAHSEIAPPVACALEVDGTGWED